MPQPLRSRKSIEKDIPALHDRVYGIRTILRLVLEVLLDIRDITKKIPFNKGDKANPKDV